MPRFRGFGWTGAALVLSSIVLVGCGGGGGGGSAPGGPAADTTRPAVQNRVPADNTAPVAPGGPFSVTFTEPVDPATVTRNTVRLTTGGVPVTGELFRGTNYVMTVTTGVEDLAGNPLAANDVVAFTTSTSSKPPGNVTGMALFDNNLAVSYDSATRTASIRWTEPASLDEAGVRLVRLFNDDTGDRIAVAVDNVPIPAGSRSFTFGSIPAGYDYSFVAEKNLSSGPVRRILGMFQGSYGGGPLDLPIRVADVTPDAAFPRLDAFCSNCHPYWTEPNPNNQIVRCLHDSGIPGGPHPPHDPDGVVKLDAFGRITCESCHTAHAPTGNLRFLVLRPPDSTQSDLCIQCH